MLTLACLVAVAVSPCGVQKVEYDRTLTLQRVHPKTGEVESTVEGVKAYTKQDPAKDTAVKWTVLLKSVRVPPRVGDKFLDGGGRVWLVKKVDTSGAGEARMCTCEKVP